MPARPQRGSKQQQKPKRRSPKTSPTPITSTRTRNARSRRTGGGGADDVSRWMALLGDPCGAALAEPCYSGVESGYLLRTVDNVVPNIVFTGQTAGSIVASDLVIQVQPSNFSTTTGYNIGTGFAGSTFTTATSGPSNFITTSNAVGRYRPVAGCLKWIPSGPYATRSGVVGVGYSPGAVITVASNTNSSNVLSSCQHYSSNGSEEHEIRWLPTDVDQTFTTIVAPNYPGCGAVFMSLKGIDTLATSATAGIMYGFIESTWIWEWVPASQNTSLSVALKPPSSTPFQVAMSRIRDIGSFVTSGMMRYPAATHAGLKLLTGGMGVNTYRRQSVPLLMA